MSGAEAHHSMGRLRICVTSSDADNSAVCVQRFAAADSLFWIEKAVVLAVVIQRMDDVRR
jgi:hypothetical protein